MRFWPEFRKHVTYKSQNIHRVGIFGFANAKENSKLYNDAYNVAYTLAKTGYTIVDGGGPGVMKAASCGGRAGGGKVIGVTFYPKNVPHFEGRDFSNPMDEEIKTDTYVTRTLTLIDNSDIFVIFNGGTGTLSEMSMAWALARIYYEDHKPIILYGNFWKKIFKVLKKNMLLRPEETKVYKIVNSPEEVLKAIIDLAEELEIKKEPVDLQNKIAAA